MISLFTIQGRKNYIMNKGFTESMKQGNEDSFYVDDELAFVIDGASGLYKEKVSDAASDAAWYSHKLKELILKYRSEERLVDVIQKALHETNKAFTQFENFKNGVSDFPSAAIAVIRKKEGQLEYYILADCECIIQYNNDKIEEISDHRVENFDNQAIATAIQIMNEQKIHFVEAKKQINTILQANRKFKNREDGYYVLSNNEDILQNGISGSIPLNEINSVLLMSDGFYQLFDLFGIVSLKQFFREVELSELRGYYDLLKQAQLEDENMDRYPRLSLSDDATIVHFK